MGMLAIAAVCATMSPGARADSGRSVTRWEGHMQRNGLQSPIVVALAVGRGAGEGQLSAGDNAVPLENVSVTATRVHFELPGEAVFDGTVAGDRMAGSISGCAAGSFELSRQDDDWSPYFLGP